MKATGGWELEDPVSRSSLRLRGPFVMIDLHCHILPGIDDGAADLGTSLQMARAAVADGVTTIACTPHILPGLYHNTGPRIREATSQLQAALDQHHIPLRLVTGADVHLTPGLTTGLRSGHLLTLADSRYVLIEPPHHVAPVKLGDAFFQLVVAGYVPIMTHPERLSWVEAHYPALKRLIRTGVLMQITAGSLAGTFGRKAQYWGNRMLDEGCVHVLATDAHDMERRAPDLGKGCELALKRVSSTEVEHLVQTRPLAILNNAAPETLHLPATV